jgi:ABC-type lipoprotein export system ATPase subunit
VDVAGPQRYHPRHPPGRLHGAVRPSGGGKTTLLNLIGCIDMPDRGKITVAGRQVQSMPDDALSDFAPATSASSSRTST